MKNAEILKENEIVEKALINDIRPDMEYGVQFITKLRSCNAEILASNNFYLLKSYNTIIAAMDSKGNTYDFLRYVYGYTATSAQHISKFFYDFGGSKMYRWREI